MFATLKAKIELLQKSHHNNNNNTLWSNVNCQTKELDIDSGGEHNHTKMKIKFPTYDMVGNP